MRKTDQFKRKERRLRRALIKVKVRLLNLKLSQDSRQEKDFKSWNDLHDLEERLKGRLWDNWSDYKSAHWEIHGFNVY